MGEFRKPDEISKPPQAGEEVTKQNRLTAIPRIVVPAGDAVRSAVQASQDQASKRTAAERVVVTTYDAFRDAIQKNGDFATNTAFKNSELSRLLGEP